MQPVLYFDHRAVLLALAVTLDFDYFSRHAGPWYVADGRWDCNRRRVTTVLIESICDQLGNCFQNLAVVPDWRRQRRIAAFSTV